MLDWGETTELLTLKQQNTSKSIIYKLSKEQDLTENEIKNGVSILDFFEIEFPEVIVPFLEE